MFNEALSSNLSDLPVLVEGAYVWHLEVIVVVVEIDLMSREYDIGPIVDSTSNYTHTHTCTHTHTQTHLF
jgi:hypothetical protein